MTVEDVLTESRRLGIVLEAHGSTLRYRAPQGMLTPELKDALRHHKAEILAHLRYHQKYPGDGPPGDAELREIEDRVYADGFVLLWSIVLQEMVAFYRDEDDKVRITPGVVAYSVEELGRLFADGTEVAASTLRLIHEAKRLGGGAVISSEGEPS